MKIDIDKEIDELVNNHSKLDLAQMVVERDSSIETLNELIEKLKCCENCKHHSFWGDELKCNLMSYDDEFECLKTKSKWELWEKEQ